MIEDNLDEDPQLALVHYNIDPSKQIFSIGSSLDSIGIPSGSYKFIPETSGLINRDFKDVVDDGNIYCYEATNQSILIKLTSPKTLSIGKNSSENCSNLSKEFTSFVEFER